jgi:hypothetical protein
VLQEEPLEPSPVLHVDVELGSVRVAVNVPEVRPVCHVVRDRWRRLVCQVVIPQIPDLVRKEPVAHRAVERRLAVRLLANETWYLWNDSLTQAAPPAIPDLLFYWPYFWHVHGDAYATKFDIDVEDRARLERLLLKHGPTEKWIVTNMNVWVPTLISEWKYRGPSGTPAGTSEWGLFTGFASPITISDVDGSSVDQQAALATFLSGDRVRAQRTDDESWIEYAVTAAGEFTGYWSFTINATPVAQSPDWAGYPSEGDLMKIYHLESV